MRCDAYRKGKITKLTVNQLHKRDISARVLEARELIFQQNKRKICKIAHIVLRNICAYICTFSNNKKKTQVYNHCEEFNGYKLSI